MFSVLFPVFKNENDLCTFICRFYMIILDGFHKQVLEERYWKTAQVLPSLKKDRNQFYIEIRVVAFAAIMPLVLNL